MSNKKKKETGKNEENNGVVNNTTPFPFHSYSTTHPVKIDPNTGALLPAQSTPLDESHKKMFHGHGSGKEPIYLSKGDWKIVGSDNGGDTWIHIEDGDSGGVYVLYETTFDNTDPQPRLEKAADPKPTKRHVKQNNEYIDIEAGALYQDKLRIFYPDGPIHISRTISTEVLETETYPHLHPNIARSVAINLSKNQRSRRNLIDLLENNLRIYGRVILNDNSYDQTIDRALSVFNEYAQIQHQIAIQSELDNKESRKKLNSLYEELNAMMDENGLVSNSEQERYFGFHLPARNIMSVMPSGNDSDDQIRTLVFDYDNLFYQIEYRNSEAAGHPGTILGEAMDSPHIFISKNMRHIIGKICDVFEFVTLVNPISVKFVNYSEWAFSFVDHLTEIHEYNKNPGKFKNRVMHYPIPMRFVVQYKTTYENMDYILNQLPAHIIQTLDTVASLAYIKDTMIEMWNGNISLVSARHWENRDWVAPQIWDMTYFLSSLTPRYDGKWFVTNPDKSHINQEYQRAVFNLFSGIPNSFFSGTIHLRHHPYYVVKYHREAMDEVGWLVAFKQF